VRQRSVSAADIFAEQTQFDAAKTKGSSFNDAPIPTGRHGLLSLGLDESRSRTPRNRKSPTPASAEKHEPASFAVTFANQARTWIRYERCALSRRNPAMRGGLVEETRSGFTCGGPGPFGIWQNEANFIQRKQ
jgi:hypothetical protein